MSTVEVLSPNALSQDEQELLQQHEATIEQCLDATERLLIAFYEIKEKRLYRAEYSSYEQYCKQRWGHTRRTGYMKAQAGEVLINLLAGDFSILPNTKQARPLAGLSPEAQREAWADTLAYTEQKPTQNEVEKAIARCKEKKTVGATVQLDSAITDEQEELAGQQGTVVEVKRNGTLAVQFGNEPPKTILPGQVSLISAGEPPQQKPPAITRTKLKDLLLQCFAYYEQGAVWPDEFLAEVREAIS